jgi:hypothetical protein
MLDDEVGVDDVERLVGERQRAAQVGDDEFVHELVRPPARLVEVDPHEPLDPVAVGAQAARAPAAGLEHGRARTDRLVQQVGLDLRVGRVKRRGASGGVGSAILESRGWLRCAIASRLRRSWA